MNMQPQSNAVTLVMCKTVVSSIIGKLTLFKQPLVGRVAVGMGIFMGIPIPMGWEWENFFLLWESLWGSPQDSYGYSHGIPMVFPQDSYENGLGMGLKFHSRDNRVSRREFYQFLT